MSVDLSKLQHNDQCRYWDDGEFCTCGADTYEELKEVRAKVEQLERSNKELRESASKWAAIRQHGHVSDEQLGRYVRGLIEQEAIDAALSAADAKGEKNG